MPGPSELASPLGPAAPPPVGVLLVEDNPLDARAALDAAGKLSLANTIEQVSDGAAALEYLRAGPWTLDPGLVLLDLHLPGLDGHDVLAAIRADPVLSPTPVLVLTTSDDAGDIALAYRRGANAFITKPVGLDGWLHVLSTIRDFWLSVARLPLR